MFSDETFMNKGPRIKGMFIYHGDTDDRQTDTTENITFATSLAGSN